MARQRSQLCGGDCLKLCVRHSLRRFRRMAPAVQQLQQRQREGAPACGAAAASSPQQPAKAAGVENTSPTSLLGVAEPFDAKLPPVGSASPRTVPTSSRLLARPQEAQQRQRQRQQAAQQPALRHRQHAAGRVGSSAAGVSAPAAAAPSLPGHAGQAQAAAAAPPPRVDPLEQLLQQLLAAESGGDPHSIINLYVAEQLQQAQQAQQVQRAAATAGVPAAALAPAAARQAPPIREQQAPLPWRLQADAGAAAPSSSGSGDCDLQPASSLAGQVPELAAEEMGGQHAAEGREQPPPKEQASIKLQPSEGAPSTARHRRSSSLMLPVQFDALAAAEPTEWSIAAVGPGGMERPAAGPGADVDADAQAAAQPPPSAKQPHVLPQPLERQPSAAADVGPLEARQEGGKRQYVQQWLQRSAAELAAGDSAPPASSAGYSEDPDHAAAELEALSTCHSPAAASAAPLEAPAPAGAAGAGSASSAPLAAAAIPGGASASSRSISAVTSTRRPAAPEPPSSSSPAGGSSVAPSGSRDAGAGVAAGAASAAAGAAAVVAAAPSVQLQEAPQQGEAEAGAESSSSWAGSRGLSSQLPGALSFSQLEAVAVTDAAAGVLQEAGALQAEAEAGDADEQYGPNQAAAASRSRGAPSSPAAAAAVDVRQQCSPAGGLEAGSSMPSAASPTAAATEPAASAGREAGGPFSETGPHAAAEASSEAYSEAYSSDFDSDDVEISYGDLGATCSLGQPGPAAAAAPSWQAAAAAPGAAPGAPLAAAATAVAAAGAESSSRPTSPRVVPSVPWQAVGSPPGSAGSQQRPKSPHHAALDDRYPGNPPASAGSAGLQRPVPGGTSTSTSTPRSPASRASSPLSSSDGGAGSRPVSPGSAARAHGPEAEPSALQQKDTVVVHSPDGSSAGSGREGGGVEAGSPYSLLPIGTNPADAAAGEGGAEAGAAAVEAASPAGVGSPPGTPAAASPADDCGSCPGSARVEDDTVVQTGKARGVKGCRRCLLQAAGGGVVRRLPRRAQRLLPAAAG